jgi:hypothetical protein
MTVWRRCRRDGPGRDHAATNRPPICRSSGRLATAQLLALTDTEVALIARLYPDGRSGAAHRLRDRAAARRRRAAVGRAPFFSTPDASSVQKGVVRLPLVRGAAHDDAPRLVLIGELAMPDSPGWSAGSSPPRKAALDAALRPFTSPLREPGHVLLERWRRAPRCWSTPIRRSWWGTAAQRRLARRRATRPGAAVRRPGERPTLRAGMANPAPTLCRDRSTALAAFIRRLLLSSPDRPLRSIHSPVTCRSGRCPICRNGSRISQG